MSGTDPLTRVVVLPTLVARAASVAEDLFALHAQADTHPLGDDELVDWLNGMADDAGDVADAVEQLAQRPPVGLEHLRLDATAALAVDVPRGDDLVARLRGLMYAPAPWDRAACAADPGPAGRGNRTFEWIRDEYLPAVGVTLPEERHSTFRWLCNWEPETLANVLETIAEASAPVKGLAHAAVSSC